MQPCNIQDIFKGVALSLKETEILRDNFQKLSIGKGHIILREGQPASYQYYVCSGCLRAFYVDASGKEHTLQFAVNDWWISDYTAFLVNGRAILNIECLQDAIVYRLSKDNLEELYRSVPSVESFFRLIFERYLISFQERVLANLAQSATERYLTFISTYPDIQKNVKNYHVASYLGITSESLSRIKKDLAID
ncbi:Crp/Fnr family transcriptional regulator [Flavobacterium sp. MAH-1]|uniref:Crp/Fnr family transcriptional regulator n=1 Tax=Flavobacterium agri TaxID=2743471 RepID=A0A7Y9C7J8_9FLAO|nr:Crp/Fnr family transcriptional regulator [Flavobacterium agri]NUY81484.1 Crp/Fnr family transcriptional regulator [Flavobacterium agri]NYA71508.1 Crp/Fnr family transcriptional regulator [Flavobacterium agri]